MNNLSTFFQAAYEAGRAHERAIQAQEEPAVVRMEELDGYGELASQLEWQPIETAPIGTPILLKYYKKGKGYRTRVSNEYVVTQATARRLYLHQANYVITNGLSPSSYRLTDISFSGDWTVRESEFVQWDDHLERLIVNMSAPTKKNIPIGWKTLSKESK